MKADSDWHVGKWAGKDTWCVSRGREEPFLCKDDPANCSLKQKDTVITFLERFRDK